MWVYVALGLIVGQLILVGMLFWLMFRRGDRQMEQQLTVWNQALHTCTVVIDALVKERQVQANERKTLTDMISYQEQWLVRLVTTKGTEQEPNPQPDPQPERRPETKLAGVQKDRGGPTALGEVLAGGAT